MFRYFGYGSNLSETSLRAKGVEAHSARPAKLPGWQLTFDVLNFFGIEGCTGNIQPDPAGEVHGVLYECDARFLSVLDELEAVGVAYRRLEVPVQTYSGETHDAFVYVGLPERVGPAGRPSLRYRNILVRGARDMGLDPAYVAWLEHHPLHEPPPYPPFEPPDVDETLTPEQLASRPLHVALAGHVFDMSVAPPEHEYLQRMFSGRDMTVFFLKRMDTSDGTETPDDFARSRLSEPQQRYLNDYLHEFAATYRYVGELRYGMRDDEPGHAAKLASAARAAHSFDPARQHERHGDALVASRRVLLEAEQTNRQLGHENLGYLSEVHGFAPFDQPRNALTSSHAAWDEAAAELPHLYRSLSLRRRLEGLPLLDAGPDALADEDLLRAGAVLAILSHAYWYVESAPPEALPEALAKPWTQVRERLGREQEVLTYIDLIVHNWRLIDPSDPDPRRVENMRLLTPTVDNPEENVFYLTQFEILSRCSPIVGAVVRAQEAIARDDVSALETELHLVNDALQRVVRSSLLKINPNRHGPHYVDPVVWAKTVAPFAVPFEEGIQGPSGTSSPIFNLLDEFLGRKRHETFLGKEIRALRAGYPRFWRELIAAVGEVSLTDYVERVDQKWLTGLLEDLVQVYVGENGFLGRHRMKVYGYLELAFKVGRGVTIGGFAGVFADRTWDRVDTELEYARSERLASFPKGVHSARVKEVRPAASDPDLRHVILDVRGEGLRYAAGDRCYVLPETAADVVDRTLIALGATGEERIRLTDEWRSAMTARRGESPDDLPLSELLRFGSLRPVMPRMAEALHAVTQSERLKDALLEQTTARWELWELLDLLKEEAGFEPRTMLSAGVGSTAHLARVVPPITFRPYSIASVMVDPNDTAATEIHLCVSRVRYVEDGVARHGTGSHFFDAAAGSGASVPIALLHPPRFALPESSEVPVIMIAGGSGIAPFRALALERARQKATGKTWLLLSVRSTDQLLFRDDLARLVDDGALRLEVAFSREDARLTSSSAGALDLRPGQRRRIDELLEDPRIATELLALLDQGASVMVCGSSGFAKTVDAAFRRVLARRDGKAEAAQALRRMSACNRYVLEIFTESVSPDREREPIAVSTIIEHNAPDPGYWCVIDGTVFDLTEFIELHPGGQTVLAGYAGMDATQGYLRSHAGRTEIDAMRAMYEIGRVRHVDFGGVRGQVPREGGAQDVSLAALYRAWTAFAYLVVEMQNALRADQSLQASSTTRDEPVVPRSAYRLQRAVETHERFLRSYCEPLLGAPLAELETLTCGLLGDPRQASAFRLRAEAIRESEDARTSTGAGRHLNRKIANLLASDEDTSEGWALVQRAVEAVEELDADLLATLKARTAEALRAFEVNGPQALDVGGEVLISTLDALHVAFTEYHRSARWRLSRAGVTLTSTMPPPRPSPVNDMRTLAATTLWHMEEDPTRGVVVLRRSARPVESLDELVAQNHQIIEEMRPEHLELGIMVDMRQAPSRNDAAFEDAMRPVRVAVNERYARVALLVTSASGMLQVNRLTRDEGARTTWATQSEDAALRFASGQA